MSLINLVSLDLITLIFQIINIIALIAIVLSLSFILYYSTKIIIKKGKNIDNNKGND